MADIADLIVGVKVIAVAAADLGRANRFYRETLGLPAHVEDGRPVQIYDGFPVGAFLDSEGNKFWFCSMA